MRNRGNLWAGCAVLGVAVGFIISYFTNYGVGMPIGALLGVGSAFIITSIVRQ